MLTEDKNRLLTEVGPGTEMGDYLRRYWHPVAGVSEFETRDVKPVRLMGEDLVLFKDLDGNFGLLERHCAHRRADLSYGYVERQGLRCSYHGWQFDASGQCIHQPFEEVMDPQGRMRQQTQIKAYPVQAKAGLLWAWMGPKLGQHAVPQLPDWDLFNYENGFAQIIISELPCNWFQCQENSIDPVHFEWTHNNWMTRMSGALGPYVPTHLKIAFEEFDYGFIYRRVRGGEDENNVMWTVGRVALWPNGFYLGHHFEWRVPIDDEHTLSVFWVFSKVPKEQEPYVQTSIPTWYGPVHEAQTGRWITSHVANQDFVVWAGQGAITDRTREKLGQSDKGIVMMRQRFFKELEQMRTDPDFVPKGLILDARANQNVHLPSACWEPLKYGLPRKELAAHPLLGPYLKEFFGQAGQPESVRLAYEAAIGQKTERASVFKVHGSLEEESAAETTSA